MPYVSPATVAAGTTGLAAWGNAVKAGLDYLANTPACRVYHNAAQSAPNATFLVLAFNSERFDLASLHDTATNNSRLTASSAGIYHIFGHVSWAANATGIREVQILLNGATVIADIIVPTAGAGAVTSMTIDTLYALAAGNYVELRVWQNSTAALNISNLGNYSPEFGMRWVALG